MDAPALFQTAMALPGHIAASNPTLLETCSDALIALACVTIALALLWRVFLAPRAGRHWLVLLTAAFVLACGLIHAMDVVVAPARPDWGQSLIDTATALVMLLTAALLWPALPRLLGLPAPAGGEGPDDLAGRTALAYPPADTAPQVALPVLERRLQARTDELNQTREALQREQAGRMRAERLTGALETAITRDVRAPLTYAGGAVHLLYADPRAPADTREALVAEALQHNGRALRGVERLLDLARIQTTSGSPVLRSVSLVSLAQEAVQAHQTWADERGTRLLLDRLDESSPVYGDPERLQQALAHLIHDALQRACDGRAVTVSVLPAPGGTRVCVSDDGRPLRVEDRERLVERLLDGTRSDGPPAEEPGTGLSIARAIAEQHGGRLWLEGEPGSGCTVYLEIPLQRTAGSTGSASGAA